MNEISILFGYAHPFDQIATILVKLAMTFTQKIAPISVDVWFWDNRHFTDCAPDLCKILSTEEIARRDRFLSAEQALHWAVSRAKVREHLGRVTETPPRDLVFHENAYGQLSLECAALPDLSFSISHDSAYSVLAVCERAPVGVDIESIQDLTPEEMDWPLSPTERQHLSETDPEDRMQAFFRYWTLKEAFIKALGLGVSFPLHDFDMSRFDERPRLLRVKSEPDAPSNWVFEAREIRSNLRLALAVKSGGLEVKYAYHAKNEN